MSNEDLQRIGDILIEEGAVTHEDVVRLISESGLKGTGLAQLLEHAHHVKRADLAAFLATDFSIPKIEDLRKFDLYEDAVKLVPEALARKHELVPLGKMGDVLCVARPTYFNKAGLIELRRSTGLRVKVFVAEEGQVLAALDRIYGKTGAEIPPPKAQQPDTNTRRAVPPPVQEDVADAIPLIALPDDPDNTPVLTAPARPPETLAVEPAPATILEAVRIQSSEFEEEQKRSGAMWIQEFEDTFLGSHPVAPIRMA